VLYHSFRSNINSHKQTHSLTHKHTLDKMVRGLIVVVTVWTGCVYFYCTSILLLCACRCTRIQRMCSIQMGMVAVCGVCMFVFCVFVCGVCVCVCVRVFVLCVCAYSPVSSSPLSLSSSLYMGTFRLSHCTPHWVI
jgi:hypothetical protein